MKAKLSVLATLLALAVTSSAAAQTSPPAPSPGPPAAPPAGPPAPPQPAPAALSIGSSSVARQGRALFVLTGQAVRITGTLKPLVPGQSVLVELWTRGHRFGRVTALVHRAKGGVGAFSATLRPRYPGNYRVQAIHAATPGQAAGKAKPLSFGALPAHAAPGSSGVAVTLLQRALASLGYVATATGRYDEATALAVLAFRSANGMDRGGNADERVFGMALAGQGAFRLRYPGAGRHVEFDFNRQVLALADRGRAQFTYHTSSGKPSTPTVLGTYSFYSQTPGTNQKGMFDSSYFIGGYAVHGYPDVPDYPASHGCIRVPMSDAVAIFRWIRIGERIFAYR